MGDQLQLPKGAIWLLVLLIIGIVAWQVYMGYTVNEINAPGGFVVKFSNSTPPVKDTMTQGEELDSGLFYQHAKPSTQE